MRRPNLRSRLGLAGLALLALPAAAFGLAFASAATANIPVFSPGSCGRANAGVLAEFDIPDGAAIAEFFPDLAGAPEISDPEGPLHDGPLHVVAFLGSHEGVPMYHPAIPEGEEYQPYVPRDVVCIIRPDGDPWYFSDVDFSLVVP